MGASSELGLALGLGAQAVRQVGLRRDFSRILAGFLRGCYVIAIGFLLDSYGVVT